jgi:RNA polymerase sigma-70 factor (sigma-E family)
MRSGVMSELRPRDEVVLVQEHLVAGPGTRTGRDADFSAWVREHQRHLLGFAVLVTGDRATAEDVLQASLARAYLRWSRLSAEGQHPLGYVRRTIINENASLWRRAWKRRERATAEVPETADAGPAAPDTTWALVQALPRQQRAAVALRYYADLTVAEAATVMGCSPGAVKTHTSRAIAKLKDALSADQEDQR